MLLEVRNHVLNAVGVAMGDVNGDEVGRQAFGHQLGHGVAIGLLDPQRDRGVQPLGFEVAHKSHIVQIKAVHHIKVTVLGQPLAVIQ